jgi:hypothetical protein
MYVYTFVPEVLGDEHHTHWQVEQAMQLAAIMRMQKTRETLFLLFLPSIHSLDPIICFIFFITIISHFFLITRTSSVTFP